MTVGCSRGSPYGRACGAMTVGLENEAGSWRRGATCVGGCGGATSVGGCGGTASAGTVGWYVGTASVGWCAGGVGLAIGLVTCSRAGVRGLSWSSPGPADTVGPGSDGPSVIGPP